MRSHLAAVVCLTGCLANHPTARHAAMIAEGSIAVGGLVMAATTPTTPCYHEGWEIYNSCDSSRALRSLASTAMILGGIAALFVTAIDHPPEPPIQPRIVAGAPSSVLLGMPLQPKL